MIHQLSLSKCVCRTFEDYEAAAISVARKGSRNLLALGMNREARLGAYLVMIAAFLDLWWYIVVGTSSSAYSANKIGCISRLLGICNICLGTASAIIAACFNFLWGADFSGTCLDPVFKAVSCPVKFQNRRDRVEFLGRWNVHLIFRLVCQCMRLYALAMLNGNAHYHVMLPFGVQVLVSVCLCSCHFAWVCIQSRDFSILRDCACTRITKNKIIFVSFNTKTECQGQRMLAICVTVLSSAPSHLSRTGTWYVTVTTIAEFRVLTNDSVFSFFRGEITRTPLRHRWMGEKHRNRL